MPSVGNKLTSNRGGAMKVRLLIRVVLVLLEILAKHTETKLDDQAVEKLREIIEPKPENSK